MRIPYPAWTGSWWILFLPPLSGLFVGPAGLWRIFYMVMWDKRFSQGQSVPHIGKGGRKYFFLFLHKNICCGYSLEVPWQGTFNEYPQHMFLWRSKKTSTLFGWKKHLIYSYGSDQPAHLRYSRLAPVYRTSSCFHCILYSIQWDCRETGKALYAMCVYIDLDAMISVLKFCAPMCLKKWHTQRVQTQIRLLLIRVYIVYLSTK